MSASNPDSGVTRRPGLGVLNERTAVSLSIVGGLLGVAIWLGFWMRDREAARESQFSAQLAAASSEATKRMEMLTIEQVRTRTEILAAIERINDRVSVGDSRVSDLVASVVRRDRIESWVRLFQAQNPALTFPAIDR